MLISHCASDLLFNCFIQALLGQEILYNIFKRVFVDLIITHMIHKIRLSIINKLHLNYLLDPASILIQIFYSN